MFDRPHAVLTPSIHRPHAVHTTTARRSHTVHTPSTARRSHSVHTQTARCRYTYHAVDTPSTRSSLHTVCATIGCFKSFNKLNGLKNTQRPFFYAPFHTPIQTLKKRTPNSILKFSKNTKTSIKTCIIRQNGGTKQKKGIPTKEFQSKHIMSIVK